LADDEQVSELGALAVRRAIDEAGRLVDDIDLIVCATSTPEWIQPATAAAIHGRAGLPAAAGAVDVNVACSGFVHALHLAVGAMAITPSWDCVVVVGAECWSRMTDPGNRSTRVLFGDGAGAVVLVRDNRIDRGIIAITAGTRFDGHDALLIPQGGSHDPVRSGHGDVATTLRMDGRRVREYAVPALVQTIRELCAVGRCEVSDLNLVVPHQSNLRMLEEAARELGIGLERFALTISVTGNTGAASIPIALDAAVKDGRATEGARVALAGYGGGLSRAGVLIRW
jgi:3-oxoacyl-[acyl-carrier-protein] synthase-3